MGRYSRLVSGSVYFVALVAVFALLAAAGGYLAYRLFAGGR
jgi:hypothetical protein